MTKRFQRTEMIFGNEKMKLLANTRIAVFGIGGVGSYVVEALARSGIEHFVLVDNDTVSISNINRQLIATEDTVGRKKVEIAKQRVLSINPNADVETFDTFFLTECDICFNFSRIDYIVDAVDNVTAKIELALCGKKYGIPVISAMGTGNKLDPTAFMVADITDTKVCPLARIMRKELKKRGVEHLKVVYSKEKAIVPLSAPEVKSNGRPVPGSVSFVPGVAGLILAGEVIKDIIK